MAAAGDRPAGPTSVRVHPLALFSILDHYGRRPESSTQVIGTLMGKPAAYGGAVEITACFAVPHATKGDTVAVGQNFNRQMLALHRRVNKGEVVVGWYATATSKDQVRLCLGRALERFCFFCSAPRAHGAAPPPECGTCRRPHPPSLTPSPRPNLLLQLNDSSSLIHDFYAGECEDPIHLVVDPAMYAGAADKIGITAYLGQALQIGGDDVANTFTQLPVAHAFSEAERICVDRMAHGQDAPWGEQSEAISSPDSAVFELQASVEKLLSMLDDASEYVDSVVDGKVKPNPDAGRDIASALAQVPRLRPQVFDKAFNNSLQDMLMVSYLSSITKAQLVIAEKLSETM